MILTHRLQALITLTFYIIHVSIVEASILEGTRLGVPLPISLAHIVTNNTQFRGYTIPRKNTCVIANLYAAHR